MVVVGIDPGLKGALVRLDTDSMRVDFIDMPLMPNGSGMVKNRVDCRALTDCLSLWTDTLLFGRRSFAIIEDVQPFGNNGAVGMFSLGQSLGAARGVAAGCKYEVMLVKPAVWKKGLGLSRDKEASLAMARKLFPRLELHLKKHEGRAEAALLAHWYMLASCGTPFVVVS